MPSFKPFTPARPLVAFLTVIAAGAGFAVVAAPAGGAGPAPIVGAAEPPTPIPPELVDKLGEMPSAGATGMLGAAAASGERHGLGLPSYKEILGKGWKRTAAQADRRFANRLDASEAAPKGGAGAGRINADEFDRMFKAGDTVKGKGGKQTRKLKVAATLSGGCPQLNEMGSGYGWAGTGRATYEVTTTERVGRYDVITAVVLDGSFHTRPSMDNDSTADEFSSADYGEIAITRNQVAVDRRTGKRSKIGETERFTSSLDPFYKPEGSFEAFIESQDDDAPAPSRPLRSSAWTDAATWFITIPYDAMRSRVLDAAKLAATPNKCVTVSFDDAPTHLAPGQTVNLTGVPHLTHDNVNPFFIQQFAGKIGADWINMQGQSAAPLGAMHQLWNGKPWYSFTAPAQEWPDARPVGLDFEFRSAAGVATTPVSFKAEDPTVYYEILDASIDNHTEASRPSSYCGEVGGSQSFGGSFDPEPFSTDDYLKIEDGDVSGEVVGNVQAEWYDHHLYGCTSEGSCTATMPDRTPQPDGSWPVALSFSEATDPSKIRLDWGMDEPEVGFVDAGDDECNSHVWGYFPQETRRTTVSRSELQGTEPITLTFAGTGHLDRDNRGGPASIDHTWSYSLTIQRVDASGQPLG